MEFKSAKKFIDPYTGSVHPCDILIVKDTGELRSGTIGKIEYCGLTESGEIDYTNYTHENRWIVGQIPDDLQCCRFPKPGEIVKTIRAKEYNCPELRPYKDIMGELTFEEKAEKVYIIDGRSGSSMKKPDRIYLCDLT